MTASRTGGAVRLYPPVVIPDWLPAASLSPNARVHWRTKAKAAQSARTMVWASVLHARWPTAPTPGRKRLTITMTRKRLMDGDNAYAICKSIVDGVVHTNVVVDDSLAYLEIVVRQVKGEPCTTLDLEEIDDGF